MLNGLRSIAWSVYAAVDSKTKCCWKKPLEEGSNPSEGLHI